jgi:lipopolysaccharide biosynthesis glycosyltransferase
MNANPDTFYDIFILHNAESDLAHDFDELKKHFTHFNLTFRTVRNEFQGAFEIRGIPETAYYRLISPELIPEYDKFLYSDVDVIFREDLGKYYDIELGDHYFGAVDNGVRLRPSVQRYVTSLGLDPENGYFYSGNLLINAALQRQDKMADRFRECAKTDFYDQDMAIINIVCNKRILPIGPSFCLSNFLYKLIVTRRDEMIQAFGEEEIRHALEKGIVDYNGAKPWKRACINMDIWWHYFRESPFYDEEYCFNFWEEQTFLLERTTLKKRMKMLLRYPMDKKNREL